MRIAVGTLLIAFALVAGYRAIGYANNGRAYTFTDVSGKGLWRSIDRDTRPGLFWSVLLMHIGSSIALLLIGGALVMRIPA